MASKSITCVHGTVAPADEIWAAPGEEITINLTHRSTPLLPYNGTGGFVRLLWRVFGSTVTPQERNVAGNALGLYSLQIPRSISRHFVARMEWDIFFVDSAGNSTRLKETGSILQERSVGPVGEDIDATPAVVVLPPLEQTITITSVLDSGTGVVQAAHPPVRAPHGVPTYVRVVVPELQALTGTVDATAVGTLYLSKNGAAIGSPIPMPQTAGTPGEFIANIHGADQIAAGLGVSQYFVVIKVGLEQTPRAAFALSDITYVSSGIPANQPPTATITSPIGNTIVAPGPVLVAFTASDANPLTSASFAALVDGVATSDVVSYAGGVGSVTVHVSTSGTHTVGVRVTNDAQLSTIATASLNVVAPTVVLTTDATHDEGVFSVSVTASDPTPVNGLTVQIRSGVSVIGSGTITAGAATITTTTALSAGSYALVARLVTAAGNVDSEAVTVTVANEAPTVSVSSPTTDAIQVGASYFVTATITPPTHGTLSSTQYRVNGGSWATLPQLSGTTYRTTLTAPATVGALTVDVRGIDSTLPTGTITTATVTTSTVPAVVSWTGAWNFATQYASQQAPTSGDLVLALDPSVAVDGATLDLTVPPGCASFNWTIPSGWRIESDATVSLGGVTLDGGYSWQFRANWRVFLRVDATNQIVRWSARLTEAALTTALIWPLSNTLAAYRNGSVVPSSLAVAIDTVTFPADPSTEGVGFVARGGAGSIRHPLGVTLNDANANGGQTIFGRFFFAADWSTNVDSVLFSEYNTYTPGDPSNLDFYLFTGLRYLGLNVRGDSTVLWTPELPQVGIGHLADWHTVVFVDRTTAGTCELWLDGRLMATRTRAGASKNTASQITSLGLGTGVSGGRDANMYARDIGYDANDWDVGHIGAFARAARAA